MFFLTAVTAQSIVSAKWSNTTVSSTRPSNNSFDCQSILSSWHASTSSAAGAFGRITYITDYFMVNQTLEYGAVGQRTVIDGVTHAEGTINVTSTSVVAGNHSTVLNLTWTPTLSVSPPCTISPGSCSKVWESYGNSLGGTLVTLPYNMSMSNTPRCHNSDPVCYTRRWFFSRPDCRCSADNVKLYYWPEASARATITQPPRSIVTKGITMFSPSIYMWFDNIWAATGGAQWVDCANNTDSGWVFWSSTLGSRHSAWFSALPESMSTVEKMICSTNVASTVLAKLDKMGIKLPATFPNAAIDAMLGGEDYSFWADAIYSASSCYVSSSLDVRQLDRPSPRAYYLEMRSYAPEFGGGFKYPYGCHPQASHPQCNTIFDAYYRAQISLPAEIQALDPAWKNCEGDGWGAYDPPVALGVAVSADGADVVTTPAQPKSIPQSPTPTATWTMVSSLPEAQTGTSHLSGDAPAHASKPQSPAPAATSSETASHSEAQAWASTLSGNGPADSSRSVTASEETVLAQSLATSAARSTTTAAQIETQAWTLPQDPSIATHIEAQAGTSLQHMSDIPQPVSALDPNQHAAATLKAKVSSDPAASTTARFSAIGLLPMFASLWIIANGQKLSSATASGQTLSKDVVPATIVSATTAIFKDSAHKTETTSAIHELSGTVDSTSTAATFPDPRFAIKSTSASQTAKVIDIKGSHTLIDAVENTLITDSHTVTSAPGSQDTGSDSTITNPAQTAALGHISRMDLATRRLNIRDQCVA